jgi:hypothetical protein
MMFIADPGVSRIRTLSAPPAPARHRCHTLLRDPARPVPCGVGDPSQALRARLELLFATASSQP